MKNVYNSVLYVNIDMLRQNVLSVAETLPEGTKIIPVLKSDAYGMGMLPFARSLVSLPAVEMLAVAHVSEALELRAGGIGGEILVLGNPAPGALDAAAEAELTLTVGRLGLIPELASLSRPCRVEIKLDTGLHRVGVAPGEELDILLAELHDAGERVTLRGVYSHFADTEDAASCARQYSLFEKGTEQIRTAAFSVPRRHICDSAASENYPAYALDAVRLGRRLTMDHPLRPNGSVTELASWRSCITDLHDRRRGDTLGYASEFVLPADARIATVGVGYGDGLPAALCREHGEVLVGGVRCPLLCCCMDLCFADVSGVDCAVGDEVTFFGWDSAGNFLSVQEVAAVYGGREGCEITTGLSSRVKRVYLGE